MAQRNWRARGAATTAKRLILAPFSKDLPAAIMNQVAPQKGREFPVERAALKKADQLLVKAGYIIKGGVRISAKTKKTLTIRIIHRNRRLERVFARLDVDINVSLHFFTSNSILRQNSIEKAQSYGRCGDCWGGTGGLSVLREPAY